MSKFFKRKEKVTLSGYADSECSGVSSFESLASLQTTMSDLSEKLVEYQRATMTRLDSVEDSVLRGSTRLPTSDLAPIRESTSTNQALLRASSSSSTASNQSTRPSRMPLPYTRESTSTLTTRESQRRASTRLTTTTGPAKTPIAATIYPSSPVKESSVDVDYLVALDEMKREVENIRRDVMVELHTTKYDLLKEMAMLKGAVLRLVDTLDQRGPIISSPTKAVESPTERQERTESEATDPCSTSSDTEDDDDLTMLPYMPRQSSQRPSTRQSMAKKKHTAHRLSSSTSLRDSIMPRDSTAPPPPPKDESLTQPWDAMLAQHLPLLDTKPKTLLLKGTRRWAMDAFKQWKHSPQTQVLAVVGGHGTGKSTFLGHLVTERQDDILASHFVRFDQQVDATRVVLSLARQIATAVPDYKHQLKRLNIPYLAQEPDAIALAMKLLVEPLHAITTIVPQHVIVLDGLDEDGDAAAASSTSLLDVLAAVALEFPPWVCFVVGGAPAIESKLPRCDRLSFSLAHKGFAADCLVLAQTITTKHAIDDADVAPLLKSRSAGSCHYLQFVDYAFAMLPPGTAVDATLAMQLPASLADIFADIFDDKYGAGRKRTWQKAQPVLEMIVAAAMLSFQKPSQPFVTESAVAERLQYTPQDLALVRRSFGDIVSVRDGVYRLHSQALVEWLVDPARDALPINVDRGMHILVHGTAPPTSTVESMVAAPRVVRFNI
ncbi:Aste57867_12481 [Aphanomyces stellatus]|uniref:Aste57867_12481 protein n=1 Tax=Aphanomyces stellatus TaxID=120398 RepID=A0A485KW44_9STRA|nr:hypothetical protein As57867_012435 [Aphanomyces stellatus]VFT89332.1 Aste57867_12481 [Aphanomyces stellatus]